MKRDHASFVVNPIRGLYVRGDVVSPPVGYLSGAKNIVYSSARMLDNVETVENTARARVREDFKLVGSLPAVPSRFYVYTKSTGNRIILLGPGGKFWDAVSGLNILTVTDAVDFHGITLNDRFYFTPHNRTTGITGQYVYLYDPALATTARKAAGAPATGTFTVSSSAVAGSVEPGIHIVAISNVTDTGFITKPALHLAFVAPNPRKKVSFPIVPLGPAGTVARIIWMSQALRNWDGNLVNSELFKLYRIENNTTTNLSDTADAYDGALLDSADPYVDTLQEIPAGTFLTDLDGRLVVCGINGNYDVLHISNQGEPENIDGVDGLLQVVKGNGGGIRTTRPQRGNILWWKKNMTGIVRPNSDTPANWAVEVIDWSLGSEVYGVSEALNGLPNMFYDTYVVANQFGLIAFNGSYVDVLKPLSYNINALWLKSVFLQVLDTVKVIVDPINTRLYVLITDNFGVVTWLFGDFTEGLNGESIKWSTWNYVYSATLIKNFVDAHVIVNPDINKNDTTLLAVVDDDSNLRELITNTFSSGADLDGDISASIGVKISDPELKDLHLSSIRLIASASQNNSIGHTEIVVRNGETFLFTPALTDDVVEVFPQQVGRMISFDVNALSTDLNVAAIILYLTIVAQERSNQ